MDIDEYVVDIANNEGLAEGLQEIDGGVTVHNACHARAQNMGIKSRDMLKFEWPLLLPKDENIKRLSSNTMDIDEYVVDIANNEGLAEGLQEIDGGVTVHNACHARAQNMGIKSRDMLKFIPNVKLDVVEKCAGHGGTFGVMKDTHDLANKVGRPTARQIKNKNNKYMASDCPLAGKHLKQLETDTNISNDEALHPIELMAKSYKL